MTEHDRLAVAAADRDGWSVVVRRDGLLEAVAFARRVFEAERRFGSAIQAILERLGRAAGVERAYVFVAHRPSGGARRFSMRHEWVAPGVVSEIDHPDWQDLDWDHDPHWLEAMEAGLPSVALAHRASDRTRAVFDRHGIRSCCDVPIVVDGELWGHLGFDALAEAREWTAGELLAATAVAQAIAVEIAARGSSRSSAGIESQIRSLIDAAHGSCVVDFDGTVTFASDRCAEIVGRTPEEIVGRPVAELLAAEDVGRARRLGRHGRRAPSVREEWRLRHADGSTVVVDVTSSSFQGPSGVPVGHLALVTALSAHGDVDSALGRPAGLDLLTGIATRASLTSRVADDIAAARPRGLVVATLSVGLERATPAPDALGETARDELLREVSRRLVAAAGRTAAVARSWAEAFLIALRPATAAEATVAVDDLVARVTRAFAQPFLAGGIEFPVRPRVGRAVWPSDARDAASLLRRAEAGMRAGSAVAGAARRGSDPPPARPGAACGPRTAALRQAIDRGELALHFQPIVRLGRPVGARVVGMEALVRWPAAGGGLRKPREFVPLAVESGLIGPLTAWVVSEASRQVQAWRAAGIRTDVFVNVSPDQLFEDGVADDIARRATAAGDRPSWLVVEVTESAAMLDPPTTLAFLKTLRSHGVRVAIDDFGTGYSSLDRMLDLDAEFLKLDRSIVTRAATEPRAREVVRAITRMADALAMPLIAEGIETAAQQRAVTALGCRLAQGFRFGRPAPGDACARLWHPAA